MGEVVLIKSIPFSQRARAFCAISKARTQLSNIRNHSKQHPLHHSYHSLAHINTYPSRPNNLCIFFTLLIHHTFTYPLAASTLQLKPWDFHQSPRQIFTGSDTIMVSISDPASFSRSGSTHRCILKMLLRPNSLPSQLQSCEMDRITLVWIGNNTGRALCRTLISIG